MSTGNVTNFLIYVFRKIILPNHKYLYNFNIIEKEFDIRNPLKIYFLFKLKIMYLIRNITFKMFKRKINYNISY